MSLLDCVTHVDSVSPYIAEIVGFARISWSRLVIIGITDVGIGVNPTPRSIPGTPMPCITSEGFPTRSWDRRQYTTLVNRQPLHTQGHVSPLHLTYPVRRIEGSLE